MRVVIVLTLRPRDRELVDEKGCLHIRDLMW